MKTETIQPVHSLSGGLELPGDKSISHRYAMLAALAEGTSEFRNFAAASNTPTTNRAPSPIAAFKLNWINVLRTDMNPLLIYASRVLVSGYAFDSCLLFDDT